MANGKSKKRIKVRAGHGYIRQNYKSSTFKAEVMIEGQRLSKSFPDVESAQQWLEEVVRRSYKFGISLDKAKVTFGELARMFLEAKEIEGRKKTTLQDYRGTIRCCNAMWENTPVQRITPDHITRLLAMLKKGGLHVTVEKTVWEYDPAAKRKVKRIQPVETVKAPYSPKHLRNIHGTIHAVLEYGVTVLSILEYNAADKVKAPSVPLADPKAWDDQSLQRFLKAVEGKRNETLLWVLATTGLRKGELVGLKWSDINLTTGEVTIKRRVVRLGYGNGVDISTPKSRAGMRVINLAEPALEKLRAWVFQQQLERAAAGESWRDEGWVFTSRTGKYVEPRKVNVYLQEVIDEVGLEPITVHGLRHTFCTWLLRNGVPVKDVSDTVGHSKPSVTLNLYWQSIPGVGARVSAKVTELLLPASPASPPVAGIGEKLVKSSGESA